MKVGHNTPEVDAAGMGYTDGSCCEDKIGHGALPAWAAEGEIKERRGGRVRSTRQACGRSCHQKKKERRGKGGSGTRDEA